MINAKWLNIISLAATAGSFGLQLFGDWAYQKQSESEMAEMVNKVVDEKFAEFHK